MLMIFYDGGMFKAIFGVQKYSLKKIKKLEKKSRTSNIAKLKTVKQTTIIILAELSRPECK